MRIPTVTDPTKKKKKALLTSSSETRATPVRGESAGSGAATATTRSGKRETAPVVSTAPTTARTAAQTAMTAQAAAKTPTTPTTASQGQARSSGQDVATRIYENLGIHDALGSTWGGQADPIYPLLTERGVVEKRESADFRSLSDIYMANRDNPRVDEIIAEEEAREAAVSRDPALSEADGAALYESIIRPPDEAVREARIAEESAYDLARRGAGGAGTSYAAAVGSKAYSDTYADTVERLEDEERAEEERLADLFVSVMDAYDGTNGASIRQWLQREGVSAGDIQHMMRAVEQDWKARQAELDADIAAAEAEEAEEAYKQNYRELQAILLEMYWDKEHPRSDEQIRQYAYKEAEFRGMSQEDADEILKGIAYVYTDATAEDGTAGTVIPDAMTEAVYNRLGEIYTGGAQDDARQTLKREFPNASDAVLDAAFAMYDEDIHAKVNTSGKNMAEAIQTGMGIDTYQPIVEYYDSEITAEKWSQMSEEHRKYAVLDAMEQMVIHEGMDVDILSDVVTTIVARETQLAAESQKDIFSGKTIVNNRTMQEVAQKLLVLREYRTSGALTQEEYKEAMRRVAASTNVLHQYQQTEINKIPGFGTGSFTKETVSKNGFKNEEAEVLKDFITAYEETHLSYVA